MMLMGALAANAQIANGSDAPQIAGTNLVAPFEEISIQTYLDQGKTVIIDISATWCSPCWGFHNSHTLEDLYAAYGPEGSDELRVIFIEGDSTTPVAEMDGHQAGEVTPPGGPSQGNWLEGTPFPMINHDTAANLYDIAGFPTLFIITPNAAGQLGTATELDRDNLGAMVAAINEARGADMVGVDGWGKVVAAPVRSCDAALPVTAFVQGYGHDVTSVEVQLKKDGEVLTTETFNGLDIQAFAYGEVTFTDVVADGTADYQAVLTKVNGLDALTTEPEFLTSEEYTVLPDAAADAQGSVTVTIHTDEFPKEMKFYIIKYDEAGTALVAWSKSFPSNTATYKEQTFTYVVPDANILAGDCYGIVLQDSYGDGWITNTSGEDVPHGVTVTDANGTVLFENDGNFGQQFWQDATFTTDLTAGNEEFASSTFAVYPNPSTGIFNFSTEETVDVTVVDITGKTVHTAKGIENGGSINLSTLQSGMYIAKINGASGERIEKLIIK